MTLLIAALGSGCSGTGRDTGGGVAVRDAYARARTELEIREGGSPLRPATMPQVVAYPPEYFAVYVPTHVAADRDILVGEHWVFMKLRDSSWFLDKERDAIETTRIIDTKDVELLRSRLEPSLHKMVVPYSDGGRR